MQEKPGTTAKSPFSGRRRLIVRAVLACAIAGGVLWVYGMAGFKRNPEEEKTCLDAIEIVKRIAPLARGEMAALTVAAKPSRVPNLAFLDAQGRELKLQDWRERVVLLNLWATWCVPCRTEMPALDALQGKVGGPGFQVVAVNIDTRDPDKPKAWLKEVGIQRLAYFADPQAKIFQDLKVAGRAFGMPTTLLIDPEGCELATLAGPADWGSEDAVKVVQEAQKRKR